MTDNAYQLNMICQFLIKKLKLQSENLDFQAVNFDERSLSIYEILSLHIQVQNFKEYVLQMKKFFTIMQDAFCDIVLRLLFLEHYNFIQNYKQQKII